MVLYLEQDTQFLYGGYFVFFGYPIQIFFFKVPINAAGFPWSETTTPPNFQKSMYAKIPDDDDNNQILIKRKPLAYARDQRAVQQNKNHLG